MRGGERPEVKTLSARSPPPLEIRPVVGGDALFQHRRDRDLRGRRFPDALKASQTEREPGEKD